MDLGAWLRSLRLGQYEAAFRDNAIDEAVLPSLTAEDLKDLGVSIVGHRRKLLDAIAALRVDATAKAPTPDAPSEVERTAKGSAERRQVTVMFSDLVGSTALSARMDPEDLREILSAYQKCVADTVRSFGGFVAKYMGDGVLVYFGYPQAHEDEAEQAVRAGLALIAAVAGLNSEVPLECRVGIATGVVVVGDLIGSGEAQERGIVGETPNLAARLQAIAEPQTVVIAEATRSLLGNLFELRDLGTLDIKGIAGSVRAWAALRASSVESRFQALHATGLSALVGREEEIELLLRCWAKAKTGEGQVVLLSGEAGIGKSRLTVAVLDHLAAEPHTQLRYFCSPQHANSALYPVIGQMERAAGLAHDDGPRAKLDKLDALLAQTSTLPEDAALLAEMLSISNDGRFPALDLTPQQRRDRTLQALTRQIEVLARQNPVLMIFEDAHWIDPTSLEALGRAIDPIARLRLLLIVTFRPEFEPLWTSRSHATALTINRLAEREVEAMIGRVAGNKLLSASLRHEIIERTDGVPLFVEEMTKAVLEAQGEGEARQTAASVPSNRLAVPASLHASLMARLDRIGPAKEIAQIGAAIGREFSHALLDSVVQWPEAKLELALNRLVESGLLFRQRIPSHASYLFKHALVQDAAYGTLLREQRRALHARIAETLQRQFSEIAEGQPELLARHCTEAGLIEKAAGLWGKAGQQSRARSALVEAVAQLTKALDLIKTLPTTPALRREQMNFQVALAAALIHVKGYGAPETIGALTEARSMVERAAFAGEQPDDPLLWVSVLYGLWASKYVAFNGDEALERAQELSALAEQAKSPAAVLYSTRAMGLTLVLLGQFEAAKAQLDRGISVYRSGEHQQFRVLPGVDPGVVLWSYHSWVTWLLGYPDAAMKDVETAVGVARSVNDAGVLMYGLFHVCIVELLSGNLAAADAHGHEVLSLAEEKRASQWRAGGILIRGWILLRTQATEGARRIEAGLEARASTGAVHLHPLFVAVLARAYAERKEFTKAEHCILKALKTIEISNERWAEAEIQRTAGEIALLSLEPDTAKAEAHFERALAVARTQRAKSWELRSATSLAGLWRSQNKRDQARELLAPVYGWFTEGFDTPDLKQAKALLEELAA
jgi:class 3 adenylate cyclase/predicted ATPase